MPRGDKPYRVYRGGRVKGGVPLDTKPGRTRPGDGRPPGDGRAPGDGGRPPRRDVSRYRGPGPARAPKRPRARGWRRWPWRRIVVLTLVGLLSVFVVWAVASYLAFRDGVEKANKRLPPAAKRVLTPQDGLLLNNPTNVLLLGTDHSRHRDRADDRRSDSIMLLRADGKRNRLTYLSIPRDLRIDIPGYGTEKVNVAYQVGGPALAIRTIKAYTGLPVHHVVLVDFSTFRELIDELGGVTINVPRPLHGDKFDCPFSTQARCDRWPGWRFAKGPQKMNGQRALIYSRIRKSQRSNENDLTRAERQQAVVQALMGKMTGPGTLAKLPFVGDDLVTPLATDLSPSEFMQLGWIKFRTPNKKTLHCRLGGSSSGGYIIPSEDNRSVVLMVAGKSAPQPPGPTGDEYPPGCVRGARGLR